MLLEKPASRATLNAVKMSCTATVERVDEVESRKAKEKSEGQELRFKNRIRVLPSPFAFRPLPILLATSQTAF
jgi:hypothetical protein